MEEEVYQLIPAEWHSEMRMFTENEFQSVVTRDGKVQPKSSEEITRYFNTHACNPRTGDCAGHGSSRRFLEVYLALKNG